MGLVLKIICSRAKYQNMIKELSIHKETNYEMFLFYTFSSFHKIFFIDCAPNSYFY